MENKEIPVPFVINGSKEEKKKLEEAIKKAASSRTGLEAIKEACKYGYSLDLNPKGGSSSCSNKEKKISLSPKLSPEELVFGLIHESRHALQYEKGGDKACDIKNNTIKSQLMVSRAMEADAQAITIMATHEIVEKGDKSVFSAFEKAFPQIAEAFNYAKNNTSKREDLIFSAFKGWYNSNELKDAYENSNHVMPMIFSNPNDFSFKNEISGEQIVSMFCKTGGKSYFTGNSNMLEKEPFADISNDTKEHLDDYMERRQNEMKLNADFSYQNLQLRTPSKSQTKEMPDDLKAFLQDIEKQESRKPILASVIKNHKER